MQHRTRSFVTVVTAVSLVSLVLAASLAACSSSGSASSSPSTAAASGGGIAVSGAWVRNSPAVAGAVAGYLVIRNDGPAADALVGASSPIAKTIELHQTMAMGSGDMMGMAPVARIDVPAGGSVELKPGGFHLMMLDPSSTLTVGQTVEITLRFEKAGTVTVQAEVRAS